MTAALLPIEFTPPLITPSSPYGLDAATTWVETITDEEARRWLPSGVQLRMRTHRPSSAFGLWGADWCAAPDDLDPEDDVKTGGAFTDDDPDPFTPMTAWAFDRLQDCGNLSEFDRAQVRERAEQTFTLIEPVTVEREFATRLLTDAPTPTAVDDLLGAVSHLEQEFAALGAFGLIHARAGLLAVAEHLRLIVRDPAAPGVLRTPAGYRWVFGGGYATPLADILIGTSQTYGWRDQIEVREAIRYARNQFVAIAERSSVVGYEAIIGTAAITP
jgi:hypothetical protein